MTEGEAADLLPIVSVSNKDGVELEAAALQSETVALWMPYYSSFDFNVLLLWVMAVGTFILAGMWAGNDSCGSEHSYLKALDDQEVLPLHPSAALLTLWQHLSSRSHALCRFIHSCYSIFPKGCCIRCRQCTEIPYSCCSLLYIYHLVHLPVMLEVNINIETAERAGPCSPPFYLIVIAPSQCRVVELANGKWSLRLSPKAVQLLSW